MVTAKEFAFSPASSGQRVCLAPRTGKLAKCGAGWGRPRPRWSCARLLKWSGAGLHPPRRGWDFASRRRKTSSGRARPSPCEDRHWTGWLWKAAVALGRARPRERRGPQGVDGRGQEGVKAQAAVGRGRAWRAPSPGPLLTGASWRGGDAAAAMGGRGRGCAGLR